MATAPKPQAKRSQVRLASPDLTIAKTGLEHPHKTPALFQVKSNPNILTPSGKAEMNISLRTDSPQMRRKMIELGEDGKPVGSGRAKLEPVHTMTATALRFGTRNVSSVSAERTAEMVTAAQAGGTFRSEGMYEYEMVEATNAKGEAYQTPKHDEKGEPIHKLDANGQKIPLQATQRVYGEDGKVARHEPVFDEKGNPVQRQEITMVFQAEVQTLPDGSIIPKPGTLQPVPEDFDPAKRFQPGYEELASKAYAERGRYVTANADRFMVIPSEHDKSVGLTEPFKFSKALEANESTKNDQKNAKAALARAEKAAAAKAAPAPEAKAANPWENAGQAAPQPVAPAAPENPWSKAAAAKPAPSAADAMQAQTSVKQQAEGQQFEAPQMD